MSSNQEFISLVKNVEPLEDMSVHWTTEQLDQYIYGVDLKDLRLAGADWISENPPKPYEDTDVYQQRFVDALDYIGFDQNVFMELMNSAGYRLICNKKEQTV